MRSKRGRNGESRADKANIEMQNERKIIDILEFSCLYGYVTRGRDSPKRVYKEKKEVYRSCKGTDEMAI